VLTAAATAAGQSVSPQSVRLLGAAAEEVLLTLDTGCAPPGGRQWRANVEPRLALATWLDVTPTGAATAGGTVNVRIAPQAGDLSAAHYFASITFTSTTDCSGTLLDVPLQLGTVQVTLDLLADPSVHRVEPPAITFQMQPDDAPREQAVFFTTACAQGPGRSWSATIYPPAPWLTVSPADGMELTAPAELTLRADPSGVGAAPGSYIAALIVSSTDCLGEQADDPDPSSVVVTLLLGSDHVIDADGDGVGDDTDNCLGRPNPLQADSDDDGAGDLCDECPVHAGQVLEGACGCGHPGGDRDLDGAADCDDECPDNPSKREPGDCGCLVADLDADGDGVADCLDACPTDDAKTEPGACGCGQSDDDLDADGVAECADRCPLTPPWEEPDERGCGPGQRDSDHDALPDLFDECPDTPVGQPVDLLGCAIFELDTDEDGINDAIDQCPGTALGAAVDFGGCPLPPGDPQDPAPGGDPVDPSCADGRSGRGDMPSDCPQLSPVPSGSAGPGADDAPPAACGAVQAPLLITALLMLARPSRRTRKR
jgi:hypothetical protein